MQMARPAQEAPMRLSTTTRCSSETMQRTQLHRNCSASTKSNRNCRRIGSRASESNSSPKVNTYRRRASSGLSDRIITSFLYRLPWYRGRMEVLLIQCSRRRRHRASKICSSSSTVMVGKIRQIRSTLALWIILWGISKVTKRMRAI